MTASPSPRADRVPKRKPQASRLIWRTLSTEVGGRAAKENVDPVASRVISPNIETRVENEAPRDRRADGAAHRGRGARRRMPATRVTVHATTAPHRCLRVHVQRVPVLRPFREGAVRGVRRMFWSLAPRRVQGDGARVRPDGVRQDVRDRRARGAIGWLLPRPAPPLGDSRASSYLFACQRHGRHFRFYPRRPPRRAAPRGRLPVARCGFPTETRARAAALPRSCAHDAMATTLRDGFASAPPPVRHATPSALAGQGHIRRRPRHPPTTERAPPATARDELARQDLVRSARAWRRRRLPLGTSHDEPRALGTHSSLARGRQAATAMRAHVPHLQPLQRLLQMPSLQLHLLAMVACVSPAHRTRTWTRP